MRKRFFGLTLSPLPFALSSVGALLLALSLPAEAQQPANIHRIGVLNATSAASLASRMELFRQGLRDLGHIEGQNIVLEYRYADGKLNRLPDLAAELVRLNVAVIVTEGGQSIRAAKNATNTIPIVMAQVANPMEFVASLAKPGGNITGLSAQQAELGGKRLELLKEMVPRLLRVAVLGTRNNMVGLEMKEIKAGGQAMSLELSPWKYRGPRGSTTWRKPSPRFPRGELTV